MPSMRLDMGSFRVVDQTVMAPAFEELLVAQERQSRKKVSQCLKGCVCSGSIKKVYLQMPLPTSFHIALLN